LARGRRGRILVGVAAMTRERAEVLARRWAGAEGRLSGVTVDLEVVEVEDGFLVDVCVYRGRGPFETLGRSLALIDAAGRIHVRVA
jgi:hypothetical protein